jgi:hypothetical protein
MGSASRRLAPEPICDQADHFELTRLLARGALEYDNLPGVAIGSHRYRQIGGELADLLHFDPKKGFKLGGRLAKFLHLKVLRGTQVVTPRSHSLNGWLSCPFHRHRIGTPAGHRGIKTTNRIYPPPNGSKKRTASSLRTKL